MTSTSSGYRVRLRRITGYTGSRANWTDVSFLDVPAGHGEWIAGSVIDCRAEGDVVALVRAAGELEYEVLRAWRIEVERGVFNPIPATEVECWMEDGGE